LTEGECRRKMAVDSRANKPAPVNQKSTDRAIMGKRPPVTIQITRPEVEELINQRLRSGSFRDAEDVILQALKSFETEKQSSDEERREAIDRLIAFGKKNGLSLDGMTIRELRDEARP
jgi:Arc/MetJ-type ribon-helix-helix transcriptional regulator